MISSAENRKWKRRRPNERPIRIRILYRMNPERLKHFFPNASKSTIEANSDSRAPRPVVERSSGARTLAAKKAENQNSGIHVVRVTSHRVRLLDEDNLCEKYHVDGCRYAGLLPSDAPDKTHIIVTQKKVDSKKEEKTLIEITWP
jgi:hypothetical protein